ncbi:unnamed protein product, partial [Rotaria magnacalcarata]
PRISYPICPLQPNQILACTKASASWLTNGETPPRYLVPIKGYSKNTHAPFILKWAIVSHQRK